MCSVGVGCDLRCVLRYMSYWKGRFLDQPLTEYCSVIKTNSEGPVGKTDLPHHRLTLVDLPHSLTSADLPHKLTI